MAEKHPWEPKTEIRIPLTGEGPKSLKELSTDLDQILEMYNRWLTEEKKDSPLIPYERNACKTFLLWLYHQS